MLFKNFSVRAYRMKLEYWGIRKNKVPVGIGNQAHPRRKTKAITVTGPSSGAQPSNDVADQLENSNHPR